MNLNTMIGLLSAMASCLFFCSYVKADEVLIDRPPDDSRLAVRDQEYPDFPDFSTYLVADIIFDTDVEIKSITTYFTDTNGTWPQNEIGLARLNIFQGQLVGDDDPTLGMIVEANYIANPTGTDLVADLTTLIGPLVLQGQTQYWIGLTPILAFSEFGNENHFSSDVGPPSMGRNPGGGFGLGTEWTDAGSLFGQPPLSTAITIRGGVVPEPSSTGLFFLALALLRTRVRRR